MARQQQQYLDDIPLGDPKDSLGFAGWLDSYMDEIMANNVAVPEPGLPSFPVRPGQTAEVSLAGDGVALPAVAPGFPLKHFPSDEAPDFSYAAQPLDYNDRSGSSNSGDSRPDVLQGGALSKAAAKALAVAEKNRKAQKRFRERQKSKMLDSQRQVEQLTVKLEALMQEKSKLESRNCVLEKVVKLKDEQIATMESRSVEPVKVTADGTPVAQDELFDLLFTFSNVVKGGIWSRDEEEAHAIPLSKIQERHKEWIEEVAKALMQGAEDPNSPAHARMNELIAVMRDTTTRLGVLNDRLMMTICSTTIVPDPSAPVPDPDYWRKVLEVTNLTHDQKVHIRLIHHELLLKVEAILKERQNILDTLSSQGGTWTADSASLNQAGQFLKQTSHVEALQRNMKAEYQVVFDFELAFYHTVLLPVQQAKMAVQAYPWPTDTLAVCSLILEEIGPLQPGQGQAATPNTQVLLQRMTGSSPFLSLAGHRATMHAPAV